MSVFQSLKDVFHPHADTGRFRTPTAIIAPRGVQPIRLRPVAQEDEYEWNALRTRNREWLQPWESGDPMRGEGISFLQWVRREHSLAEAGTEIVFMIEFEGHIVGQISLGAICYGSMRTGIVGYWVDRGHAGLGFAPLSFALLADWAFGAADGPRLHRLEVDILPENQRSKRVVEKLGIQYEGLHRQYMYINGAWRDHETYALLSTDVETSMVQRVQDTLVSQSD